MKSRSQTLSALATLAVYFCFAPASLAQDTVSKLVIKEKEAYVVGPENVLKVDTLVMLDQATIQFDPKRYAMLEAKVAMIGDKCVILNKGVDGKNSKRLTPGEDGANGGTINIILNFKSLGKLTIDTRGGNGGAGINGKDGYAGEPERTETKTVRDASGKERVVTSVVPPRAGTDGGDATMGGNGGNGGNITLMYSANDFIPVFNQYDRETNSIVILHTAGQRGRTGEPGKGGIASMDGTVKYSDIKNSQDGRIELINLNAEAQ